MEKKDYLGLCMYFHGEDSFPIERLRNADLGFPIWEAEEFGYRSIGTDTEKDIIKFWRDADLPACATNLHPYLLASLFAIYARKSDGTLDIVAKNFENIFIPRYMDLTVI